MTRWFEDIDENAHFPLGAHTFTEAEITHFGSMYDPQYFHTDPKAAKQSHFGGPIASGWHTVCIGHRLMVDALFAEEERLRVLGEEPGVSGPSPGVNKMDFKTPVRPGDTVTYELCVTGKRLSNSIAGWGLLFNRLDATNQSGELVYSAELVSFSKLRDYKPSLGEKLALWAASVPGLKTLVKR